MKYQHNQTKEIIEAQLGFACPGGLAFLWQGKDGKYKSMPPEEFNKHYSEDLSELRETKDN